MHKRNDLIKEPVHKALKKSSLDSTSVNVNRVCRPWELEHGFLVVMGGMGITLVEEQDQWILADGNTVTPYGALTLAKAGALPDFGREKVSARSKADNVGKMLVCLQALWMVTQTIARKVAGLPITLLELNTLAHVVCAVFMYIIWWRKPQNVNELFEFPVQSDLALFMKRDISPKSSNPAQKPWQPEREWQERQPDDPNFKPESGLTPTASKFKVVGKLGVEWDALPVERKQELEATMRKPDGVVMVYPGQSLDGIAWYWNGLNPIHLTEPDVDKLVLETQAKVDRVVLETRARMTTQAIARLGPGLHWQGEGLTHEASNMSISGDWEKISFETLILFAVLGFMYGGIHGSSWNAHFPSMAEQRIWRGAVCSVAVGGFVISGLLGVLMILAALIESHLENWKSWITRGIPWGWGLLRLEDFGVFFLPILLGLIVVIILLICLLLAATVTIICITLAYPFSRAFLVVESFLSLRSLPAGAYDIPSWVGYWPHIG